MEKPVSLKVNIFQQGVEKETSEFNIQFSTRVPLIVRVNSSPAAEPGKQDGNRQIEDVIYIVKFEVFTLDTWEVPPGNEGSTLKCVLPQVSVARPYNAP